VGRRKEEENADIADFRKELLIPIKQLGEVRSVVTTVLAYERDQVPVSRMVSGIFRGLFRIFFKIFAQLVAGTMNEGTQDVILRKEQISMLEINIKQKFHGKGVISLGQALCNNALNGNIEASHNICKFMWQLPAKTHDFQHYTVKLPNNIK
jgi:hypothetical protein